MSNLNNEIYYCVSTLVAKLLGEGIVDSYDELCEISFREDWETACQEFIENMNISELVSELEDRDITPDPNKDYQTILPNILINEVNENEGYEEFCAENNIDPHIIEALEHWIVSDWLADKLEARGEMIAKDILGLTIWGRTTSGQAIEMDHVMQQIIKELNN